MVTRSSYPVLASTLARASTRAALSALGPFYAGVAIFGAVIFGPNGMSAADACLTARMSRGVLVGLWACWLVGLWPAARLLIRVPETFWLRSLPVPSWWLWGTHAALLVTAQAPWMLLWGRGEGLLSGLTAAVIAAAIQAFVVARHRSTFQYAAGLAGGVAIRLDAPVGLLVGLIALAVSMRGAWLSAPDAAANNRSARFRGPTLLALCRCFVAVVVREHSGRLVRSVLLALLGAAIASLGVINNELETASKVNTVSLAISGGTLTLALAGIARSALSAEHECRWLFVCSGTLLSTRVVAASTTAGLLGVALAVFHSSVVAVAIFAEPLAVARLVAFSIPWGAALGWTLCIAVRWGAMSQRDGKDRSLAGVCAVFCAAIIAPAVFGEVSVFGAMGLSVFWTLMTVESRWARVAE